MQHQQSDQKGQDTEQRTEDPGAAGLMSVGERRHDAKDTGDKEPDPEEEGEREDRVDGPCRDEHPEQQRDDAEDEHPDPMPRRRADNLEGVPHGRGGHR